jgi:hypothetical protein
MASMVPKHYILNGLTSLVPITNCLHEMFRTNSGKESQSRRGFDDIIVVDEVVINSSLMGITKVG